MTDDGAANDRLPDDPGDWPRDPYKLLGVEQNVESRALRSRYTQLIRVYKPERFAEQFRLIRAAYESILQHLEWRDSAASDQPAQDGQDVGAHGDSDQAGRGSDSATTSELSPAIARVERQLAEIWQQACQGDVAEAYSALQRLHVAGPVDHGPTKAAIAMRLYWLAITSPELATRDDALRWLTDAWRAGAGNLQLWQLYEREVTFDRAHLLGEVFAGFLDCQPVVPLDRWCRLRWHAAAAEHQWQLVAGDLARLRHLVGEAGDWRWPNILVLAIDVLAWSPAAGDVTPVLDELHELPVARNELSREWDRIEFLLALVDAWRKLQSVPTTPPPLLELLPLTWYGRQSEIEPRLVQLAEFLVDQPAPGLRFLDSLWAVSTTVVAQLWEVFQQFIRPLPEDERSPETLRGVVCRELFKYPTLAYPALRGRLLELCCREALMPNQVAAVVQQVSELQHRDGQLLADLIRGDGPLQCAVMAYFMFWS